MKWKKKNFKYENLNCHTAAYLHIKKALCHVVLMHNYIRKRHLETKFTIFCTAKCICSFSSPQKTHEMQVYMTRNWYWIDGLNKWKNTYQKPKRYNDSEQKWRRRRERKRNRIDISTRYVYIAYSRRKEHFSDLANEVNAIAMYVHIEWKKKNIFRCSTIAHIHNTHGGTTVFFSAPLLLLLLWLLRFSFCFLNAL